MLDIFVSKEGRTKLSGKKKSQAKTFRGTFQNKRKIIADMHL